jgi:DNA-binding Xre family transcriptional regulator
MLKLNVLQLLNDKDMTKYQLFNQLNSIRAVKGEKLMNYTNFLNMIQQNNKSVLYQDLDELCEALECDISDLLTRE